MSKNRQRKVVFCLNCWHKRASIFDLFCPSCGAEYVTPAPCLAPDCEHDAEPGQPMCAECAEFYARAGIEHDSA